MANDTKPTPIPVAVKVQPTRAAAEAAAEDLKETDPTAERANAVLKGDPQGSAEPERSEGEGEGRE